MALVGTVESLWRYPVKSMRGEEVQKAFLGFAGVYGDRVFAYHSSGEPAGFPLITSREIPELLLHQPRFRNQELAARPPNLADAETMGPGITPQYASFEELSADVVTPSGEAVSLEDPEFIESLAKRLKGGPRLKLVRSHRSLTDCRPVSLFSIQTAAQLSDELGAPVDKRRFRANVYMDLPGKDGFAENAFVARSLKIGPKAVLSVLERDPRCKMVTLDPDTAESNPTLLRPIAQSHENFAGLYAAVLVEGMVSVGDPIELLD